MRIRTIKPEFFNHEGIYDAEHETKLPLRLAFIGLWCAADREGRFKWEPRRLKTQIMPYDDCDFSSILDALWAHGFVARYDEMQFGFIPSFASHQCVNMREAQTKLPEPLKENLNEYLNCAIQESTQSAPDYIYRGKNIQPKLRNYVFTRDGGTCMRCGSLDNLTVDHIFPQSIGGTHSLANLRTLCRSCNSARPVAGKALVDDLAKDGYTLSDMERICTHVQAHAEGKGREGNMEGKGKEVTCPISSDDSEILKLIWESCPKQGRERSSKRELADAWRKLAAKNKPSMETVKHALTAWNASNKWKTGFCEGIEKWVRNMQWENLPEADSANSGNSIVDRNPNAKRENITFDDSLIFKLLETNE